MTTARRATWAAALLLALHLGGAPARAEGVVLDDFETLAGWTTVASEGARVWTLQEPGHSGMGMRVGFDLGAGPFGFGERKVAELFGHGAPAILA